MPFQEQEGRLGLIAERLKLQHDRYQSSGVLTIDRARGLLTDIMGVMFPHFAERRCADGIRNCLDHIAGDLDELITAADCDRKRDTKAVVREFLSQVPDIAEQVLEDGEALLEGDPAAKSLEEVILAYPGFYAVGAYRLAHALLQLDVAILPRLMTEFAHQRTGIDIHPGATIGRRFYIDHGTAVVIGETTVIGDNVRIYQGVTLGGLKVSKVLNGKRHPTIEDNVVIYAGATILGGDTLVGHDSVIGGNVWLTRSVPAWSRVMFRSCDTEEIIPIDARRKA